VGWQASELESGRASEPGSWGAGEHLGQGAGGLGAVHLAPEELGRAWLAGGGKEAIGAASFPSAEGQARTAPFHPSSLASKREWGPPIWSLGPDSIGQAGAGFA